MSVYDHRQHLLANVYIHHIFMIFISSYIITLIPLNGPRFLFQIDPCFKKISSPHMKSSTGNHNVPYFPNVSQLVPFLRERNHLINYVLRLELLY